MTCVVDKLLKRKFEVPGKNSASSSVIVFGTTEKNAKAVLKISPASTDRDNSLQAEAELYRFVNQKLRLWSPHFVVPLAVGHCTDAKIQGFAKSKRKEEQTLYEAWAAVRLQNISERVDEKEFKKILARAKRARMSAANYVMTEDDEWADELHETFYILTPHVEGVTVEQFLSRKATQLPLGAVKDLLVQYAQALATMANFKMMHHDLHFGNAFVVEYEEPITISYTFPRKCALVTPVKLLLYDWDRGYKPGVNNKALLNFYCKTTGQCNTFTPKFDWYTVLSWFIEIGRRYKNYNVEEIEELLGGMYASRLDKAKIGADAWFGQPCECRKTEFGTCALCKMRRLNDVVLPRDYFMQQTAASK